MDRTPQQTLGMLGEHFIAKHYADLGNEVIISSDVYDMEKDMLINGRKVEVKTQSKISKYNSFSVGYNQLPKLQGADDIFFLAIRPSPEWNGVFDYPEIGNVYHCCPKFEYKEWKDSYGTKKILIPLNQKAMICVAKIPSPILDLMDTYTTKR